MTKYIQKRKNYSFEFYFLSNMKLFLQITLEKLLYLNILKINVP